MKKLNKNITLKEGMQFRHVKLQGRQRKLLLSKNIFEGHIVQLPLLAFRVLFLVVSHFMHYIEFIKRD